ncbi:MAG: hypothetical protein HC896_15285 [Bacteroidales bacterium]|nr:hypothetical protein [Bacteroidales bacterium]
MEKALSLHANEAFEELDEEGKRICRFVFTTLTQQGEDNRGIRHPEKVSAIANIAKASLKDTIAVIDKFRAPGRAFITPGTDVELTGDSVIDISHESIMRIWDKLKQWIQDEAESIQLYKRLSEASAMYQSGKAGLWRPPDLLIASNWRKKFQPNLAWAKRYDPAFERAMVFLDASESRYKNEERHKIKIQKKGIETYPRLCHYPWCGGHCVFWAHVLCQPTEG